MPPFAPTALLVPEGAVGSIMLWQGSIESIPSSWSLCDGTHGTPDLRDRFLYGNSVGSPPEVTGGTQTHDHSFTSDGHTHSLGAGPDVSAGAFADKDTDSKTFTGDTLASNHLPLYFSLCYIMFTGGD